MVHLERRAAGPAVTRLLVTGASGALGGYLLARLAQLGRAAAAWSGASTGVRFGVSLRPVDLADLSALERAWHNDAPSVVIHAAAMANVAHCLQAPDRARAVNVAATDRLARLAANAGARLLLVSTDLVFGGDRAPYAETDPPAPLSVYGRTKAEAEQAVLAHPGHAVARVSLLYGPSLTDRPGFFDAQLRVLRDGGAMPLFEDEWRTPLDLPTAAAASSGWPTPAGQASTTSAGRSG
ncbi:MAG: sugar nucleotide-binding protein [Gemmataceae bacterium]